MYLSTWKVFHSNNAIKLSTRKTFHQLFSRIGRTEHTFAACISRGPNTVALGTKQQHLEFRPLVVQHMSLSLLPNTPPQKNRHISHFLPPPHPSYASSQFFFLLAVLLVTYSFENICIVRASLVKIPNLASYFLSIQLFFSF